MKLTRMKTEQTKKQLGNATLQLLSQNKLLEELRNDLQRIARRIPPAEPVVRELREHIGKLSHRLIDWEKYDRQFREISPEFLDVLRRRVPDVTLTEMRICTMVRMRLKSREIASLLGISKSAVESHRRKIRRKLHLKKEEKLPIVLGSM